MASQQQCESGLRSLIERIGTIDPQVRKKYAMTRSISLRVPDLAIVFLATLDGDVVDELRCLEGRDNGGAQVRLAAESDDLVALLAGSVAPAVAWATGRLRIEASMLDLLKLRSLL